MISGPSEQGQERSDALQPDVYTDVAFNGDAFQWLLSNLKRGYQKDSKAWAIQGVRDKVSTHFTPLRVIDRKSSPRPETACFKVDLDLNSGLRRELIDCTPVEGFSKIITITGTRRDAQALTCRQYLTQTWPVTGPHILAHIEAIMAQNNEKPRMGTGSLLLRWKLC